MQFKIQEGQDGRYFTAIFENKINTKGLFSMPVTIKTSDDFYRLRKLTCNKEWKWMCGEDEISYLVM
ncbi:hypothetical protein ACI48J_19865 [Paenibacillus chitinolyticus]|uniref:hypothetical protein n=1 Tax=Paenibacillus chitinolyticus TaxID=79263 RepID=UPI00386BB137